MRVTLCTPQSARLLGDRLRVVGEVSVRKVGTGVERVRVKVSPSRSWTAGRGIERGG
jgi:hypothetical protein